MLRGSTTRRSLCSLMTRELLREVKRVGLSRRSGTESCYYGPAILQLEVKVRRVLALGVAVVVPAVAA